LCELTYVQSEITVQVVSDSDWQYVHESSSLKCVSVMLQSKTETAQDLAARNFGLNRSIILLDRDLRKLSKAHPWSPLTH
jgi:hypothetical protein